MIPRIPSDPALRDQRKADLLLASQLLRGQMALDVDDVGERLDVWGRRWQVLKGWLADPMVLAAASGGAAFFATTGSRRRSQLWRAAKWVWMAWKMFGRR